MRVPTDSSDRAIVFDVDFDGGFGAASNKELKGRGTLTIDPAGPVYKFTGTRRRLLSGERITVEFGPHDIANVTFAGRSVHFSARPRVPGGPVRPFEFHCRDEAGARTVAGLLPHHLLDGFVESHEFIARLNALSGARPAWATVTNVIIALNAIAFVIMAGVLGAGWVQPDDLTAYVKYGANNGAAKTDGEWWRLLTSMFMHYGILHATLNMWALFNTGPLLEKLQGRALFALTYLGSGLAGGFASILWNGDRVWSAGASGAVFGVIGGIIGFMLRQKHSVPKSILQGLMRSMLTFVALNIFLGFSIKGIDNAGHLGGLAAGVGLGWLLAMPVDREVRRRLLPGRIGTAFIALAVLVGAGVGFSPRFDYSVAEELAWNDANESFARREAALIPELDRTLAALKRDGDREACAAWLEGVAIPLYVEWREQLMELDLVPGRRTDRLRAALAEILRMKVGGFSTLRDDLRAGRADALEEHARTEARIQERIKDMKNL